jgi:hypothetical protein
VLLVGAHSLGEDDLHCMMETEDGHLRTEDEYDQEMVNTVTWHYVESEVDCLGLDCYADSWCWECVENDQEASETEILSQIKFQYRPTYYTQIQWWHSSCFWVMVPHRLPAFQTSLLSAS